MSTRVVAVVSGQVQGVGYRWFVRGLADGRRLAGSATNLPDGRVEVVLEGAEDDVAAVVGALTGPDAPGAPQHVDQRTEPAQGANDFRTF